MEPIEITLLEPNNLIKKQIPITAIVNKPPQLTGALKRVLTKLPKIHPIILVDIKIHHLAINHPPNLKQPFPSLINLTPNPQNNFPLVIIFIT